MRTVLSAEPQAEDGGTGRSPPAGASAGRIVVDRNQNMLLFRGSGKEWAQIRSVIEKLDRVIPSVLIEVLIAELTLTDERQTGFEFVFNGVLGGRGLTAGTLGALGVGAGGLSLTLDSAGDTRAVLNFFYKDDRVVIRSRPRLLVKSGETASIDVGNEIPVITQKSDSEQQVDGTTNILQEVSYRKTGLQLEIKPLVQANGLVDLEISQQLSEARPTATTSMAGSPTILNRRISTSLSLRDGGSLLMGGLISDNKGAGEAGVPVLGPAARARAVVPHRCPAGGSDGAHDHGHPLRDRRSRGRLGAHPADPRAVRAELGAPEVTWPGSRGARGGRSGGVQDCGWGCHFSRSVDNSARGPIVRRLVLVLMRLWKVG